MYTGYPFPYDINNLVGGAVRIVYAPADTAAVPADITDIAAMVAPYALEPDYDEFGATSEGFEITRGFDTEGWEIEQETGAVIEDVTETTRSLTIPIAELHPATLKIIEEQSGTTAIAAAAGKGAQTKVSFGAIQDPTRYRIAFIARRKKASGIVTEPGGSKRGRFFAGVAYQAQIAADDVSYEFAKGSLTAVGLTMTLFPDGTIAAGQDKYGAWLDEAAGIIT